ncbi:hypothetical protein GLI01_23210 [Gluconacetobacter liquefaciens]|uniref:Uncharacterized protein n=1 Tax=Gluconacetobacter liquefaciens TaxID=89584 RepID=A0A370GE42_GLULI|nr:hypothetical protein [Gluconacetobacter liquefaciens]MBB2184840.1 hypothetical protein [Gluconacetobacter liquefaciens]RDI40263.1 hypothetical protein C7453_10150 [Gluconacetobacter liquefaciens]GBQ96647.1 hypothetical protein AA0522_0820 [Gluconacetobacter liquefaciens NRIC 0522]GEB38286.1 hypothetical protein GLI01_23210 [Gluconacetobacter liquefaciens]
MIALSHVPPLQGLPVPVLCQMMQGGAARFGRRTPGPHDWPAAPSVLNHGDDRRGAVVTGKTILPFVADRLRYGIQLSSAVDVFDGIKPHLSELEDAFAQDNYACWMANVPGSWAENPERWWPKVRNHKNNGYGIAPQQERQMDAFLAYGQSLASLQRAISKLLAIGELTACGRKKTPDGAWTRMDPYYFGSAGNVTFSSSSVVVEKLRFFDVRIGYETGVSLASAMIAYGAPELVSHYLLLRRTPPDSPERREHADYFEELRECLQSDLLALLKDNHLQAVRDEDHKPVNPRDLSEASMDFASSSIIYPDQPTQRVLVPIRIGVARHADLFEWRPASSSATGLPIARVGSESLSKSSQPKRGRSERGIKAESLAREFWLDEGEVFTSGDGQVARCIRHVQDGLVNCGLAEMSKSSLSEIAKRTARSLQSEKACQRTETGKVKKT